MKVIKLDKRHRTFKSGFTHALRFDSWCSDANEVVRYFDRVYPGSEHWKWTGHYGSMNAYTRRSVYWICVKNEELLTMAILAM